MAEKRMFSKKITESDAFVEMSSSAQALYFQLNQGADDDGFNNQVQTAMYRAHASIDDLKVLMTKNYIIRFESGVIVVKHWWIHNTLRKDRYVPTNFQEELKMLGIKENKSYTLKREENDWLPNGCQMVAIDKVREDKNSIVESNIVNNINKEPTTPFDAFIKKYNINCDNYSTQLGEMDFALLDKAFAESKWLQENFVCLSKICKKYNEIISGAFKDYSKPKKKKSFGFNGEREIEEEVLNSLVCNPNDIDV